MTAIGIANAATTFESTIGYEKLNVSDPTLDEKANPSDASSVILEILNAGFCGTDRSIWYRKGFAKPIRESVLSEGIQHRVAGHELLGRVLELGSMAKTRSQLTVGDIVTSESHLFCGSCYQCKLGQQHVCSNEKIIGITAQGCFTQRMKIPYWPLWKTDLDLVRREVAAIQEPFGNAVHACSKVDLRGQVVAINGCGTIGLMAVLVARALGAAKLVGIDVNPRNRELALRLGADWTFDPGKSDQEEWSSSTELETRIMEVTRGVGVDTTIEMSGANSGLNNAIRITRRGGAIVLFGLHAGTYTIENYEALILGGKSMHSVVGREIFKTWVTIQHLLESRQSKLQDQIYSVILNNGQGTIVPLNEFNPQSFEAAMKEHPKLVFQMSA